MTVFERLIEDCLTAKNARVPVLYIKTFECDLVQEVAFSGRLVELKYCRNKDQVEFDGWNDMRSSAKKNANYRRLIPTLDEMEKQNLPYLYLVRGETIKGNEKLLESYIAAYREALDWDFIGQNVLICYSEVNYVPEYLQSYVEYIDVEIPKEEEIRNRVMNRIIGVKNLVDIFKNSNMISDMTGFRLMDVDDILRRISYMDDRDQTEEKIRRLIFQVKEQVVRRSELLELIDTDEMKGDGKNNIGGLDQLIKYISEVKTVLDQTGEERAANGVMMSKGVLVCGVPGCGKSLAAQYTAATLDVPLLRLDVGLLMNSLQGKSEHNMAQALKMAEAIAPCVLFIDELDKAFSNTKSSSSSDNGSFKRMFSRLLGWMQECKAPCFIFATANDLTGLPSEFFRSGRFDRLFATYLPTEDECISILKVRLNKRKKIAEESRKMLIQREKGVPIQKGQYAFFENNWQEDDKQLRKIIELCVEDRNNVRIVTGADIEKLVNETFIEIAGTFDKSQHLLKPIPYNVFKNTFQVVLRRTNVYGDGKENKYQISKTYLQLLCKGYVSASNSVYKEIVYEYMEESDHKGSGNESCTPELVYEKKPVTIYDIAVDHEIGPRLKQMLPGFEKSMYQYYASFR